MHLVGREALAHDEDGEESGPQDLALVGHLPHGRLDVGEAHVEHRVLHGVERAGEQVTAGRAGQGK